MAKVIKTKAQKQCDCVLRYLAGYIEEKSQLKWDVYRIAKTLKMSYETLNRRRKNPSEFKLYELQELARALDVPLSELLGG